MYKKGMCMFQEQIDSCIVYDCIDSMWLRPIDETIDHLLKDKSSKSEFIGVIRWLIVTNSQIIHDYRGLFIDYNVYVGKVQVRSTTQPKIFEIDKITRELVGERKEIDELKKLIKWIIVDKAQTIHNYINGVFI